MKNKQIFTIILLLLMSCDLFGTPIVKKGKSYSISNGNESFVFIVINIRHERDDTSVFESIDYKLYERGQDKKDIHSSFIKYRRVKNSENSSTLIRVEGTQKISFGTSAFTWSYGSDEHIYLYLENETRIQKI